MKATMLAAVLSLSVVSLPTFAITQETKPIALPAAEQTLNKINLNKADVHALTGSFKGIGKKRAEAIVSYRDAHEGFKSVADLAQVRGLGQSFVDSNLEQLERIFSVA